MSFEGERVYYTDQKLVVDQNAGQFMNGANLSDIENKLMHFVKETKVDDVFIYREQLRSNALRGLYFLRVQMDHLIAFDETIVTYLRDDPNNTVKVFETAVLEIYKSVIFDESNLDMEENPNFQVQIHSEENPSMLRNLHSNLVGKLVVVPGIITSTNKTNIRARIASYKCISCGHEVTKVIPYGMYGAHAPGLCQNAIKSGPERKQCRPLSYRMDTMKCEYVDQQLLKLQEAPELIPTGEMPRTIQLTSDRYLTDKVTPGNRVKIVGIFSITSQGNKDNKDFKSVQRSYIRVLGIQAQAADGSNYGSNQMGFAMPTITEDDQDRFEAMRREGNIYEKLTRSIAPSIYGHSDIKKAIACLLFSGCAKKLPDGMRLRGDINVLLLGDPSVAKSQFLKFVDRVAPISVYTSGKGSSAAGLTASVTRDMSSGEFQLEGGAMVLADGGIVCIDEFDKMRPQDRVAIHEAMEQQTISIAKAGITTILNSRASVLAAANPLFGRYDDLKHAAEQIDFQSSILSRFDAIFIVRDVREEKIDRAIATHVLGLHMHHQQDHDVEGEIPLDLLRKYVCYAKMKVQPKLSDEACQMLQNLYVNDRAASKDQRVSKKTNGIPITVRQLEAIIRLSEAIAKMHLEPIVQVRHVQEAHRLFKISTLNAAASGMSSATQGETPTELADLVRKIEEAIKRRVAIGTKIAYAKLQQEMLLRFDNQRAIDFAIIAMVKKGDFQHLESRKILQRQVGNIY